MIHIMTFECYFSLVGHLFEMVQRLTYKRRHCYATKSNQQRKLRTPGGKLVLHSVKKRARGPQTPVGDRGRIQGVPHLRPAKYSNKQMATNKKTVNRAYGGVLSATAVSFQTLTTYLWT